MRIEIEAREHVSESIGGHGAMVALSDIHVLTDAHASIKTAVDDVALQAAKKLAATFGGAT